MDINTVIYGIPVVALVMATVQIAKQFIPETKKKWYPVVAVLAGMLWLSLLNYNFWTPIVLAEGFIAGAIACGIWSGGKTLAGK